MFLTNIGDDATIELLKFRLEEDSLFRSISFYSKTDCNFDLLYFTIFSNLYWDYSSFFIFSSYFYLYFSKISLEILISFFFPLDSRLYYFLLLFIFKLSISLFKDYYWSKDCFNSFAILSIFDVNTCNYYCLDFSVEVTSALYFSIDLISS